MRARTALAGSFIAFALALVACGRDQQTLTAPGASPSFAKTGSSDSFSLTCSPGAGPSTVANVTIIISHTLAGKLAPLHCGDTNPNVSGFKSYDFDITVTDGADNAVARCLNTRPIHGTGSFTCGTDPYTATLTVAPAP
jgi:hypothetical protein